MAKAGESKVLDWLHHHVNYDADFCLVFPFCRNPNGYGQFRANDKTQYAHRYMCELVNGPPPGPEYEAAHNCGNGDGGCANPKHLEWKTKSQNRLDALKHGTGVRHRNGNAGSLTPEQVMQIRDLKGKKTQNDIAELFGISAPRVRAIFTGKIYKGERKLRPWTAEEDGTLKEALQRGMTFPQVANMMGKKKGSITARVYRLGLRSQSGHHACKNL